MVVCQHSHIIGCEEQYLNGRIIYGQGNFLLDDVSDESWRAGLMVEVTIGQEEKTVNYIPVQTRDHKAMVYPNKDTVLESFFDRSREIANGNAVDELFSRISDAKLSDYLVKLSGKRRLTQRVFRRLGITGNYRKLYSKEACCMILDYFYCDSHRTAIEYGLQKCISEKER